MRLVSQVAVVAAVLVFVPHAAWAQIFAGSEPSTGSIVLSNFKSVETPIVVVSAGSTSNEAPAVETPRASAGVKQAVDREQKRVKC